MTTVEWCCEIDWNDEKEEDAPEQTEIATAYEQVTTGVKRLIELSLGRKVEMVVGPWPDFYDPYDGWKAYLFTTTEGREVILGTRRTCRCGAAHEKFDRAATAAVTLEGNEVGGQSDYRY